MTRRKDPLEELVSVFVYAPIGIVIDVVEHYPDYVARGKRQIQTFERLGEAVLRGFGARMTPPSDSRTRPPAAESSSVTEEAAEEAQAAAEIAAVAEEVETEQLNLLADEAEAAAELVHDDLGAVLQGTVAEATAGMDHLSEPLLLELIELERSGKNRVTVLRAADKRLNELRDAS